MRAVHFLLAGALCLAWSASAFLLPSPGPAAAPSMGTCDGPAARRTAAAAGPYGDARA